MRGYNSSSHDFLFNKADWFSISESQRNKIVEEIEKQSPDELLNTSVADLASYFEKKYSIDVPRVFPNDIVVDGREIQIDVSGDFRYHSRGDGPRYVPGTSIDVELPFEGDAQVFFIQPTTYNFNNPRAKVGSGVVVFSVSGTTMDPSDVKSSIDQYVKSIEEYLDWLRNDARGFNASLFQHAKQHIERRRDKLLRDRNLIAGLGYRVKERGGANSTYAAPQVRRIIKPEVRKPVASQLPYTPEPTLVDSDYQHILSVLENMVRVMELSPGAFQRMDEESLRMHFLVQLNGHFEGAATGETFNFDGKTDILVKADGRNIFIAECKFWRGEKSYLETVEQLLGYVSWRDTKAAVLVFNRNKDFSDVIEKVKSTTLQHPKCKKLLKQNSETSLTYLFSQRDDPNREMIVTVQVYNIPDHIGPRISTL